MSSEGNGHFHHFTIIWSLILPWVLLLNYQGCCPHFAAYFRFHSIRFISDSQLISSFKAKQRTEGQKEGEMGYGRRLPNKNNEMDRFGLNWEVWAVDGWKKEKGRKRAIRVEAFNCSIRSTMARSRGFIFKQTETHVMSSFRLNASANWFKSLNY